MQNDDLMDRPKGDIEYELIENAIIPLDQRRRKYPFKRLRIGDGFDIPDNRGVNNNGQSRTLINLRKAALAFCMANEGRFVELVVGDAPGRPGYIRCVRTN